MPVVVEEHNPAPVEEETARLLNPRWSQIQLPLTPSHSTSSKRKVKKMARCLYLVWGHRRRYMFRAPDDDQGYEEANALDGQGGLRSTNANNAVLTQSIAGQGACALPPASNGDAIDSG